MAAAVTATLGTGFGWAGLPVSAWIQFAAGGALVLLILVALMTLVAPWSRPAAAVTRPGRGHNGPRLPEAERSRQARSPPPALAALEVADGPPFAELIVEVGVEFHDRLVEAAVDSGFVPAEQPRRPRSAATS